MSTIDRDPRTDQPLIKNDQLPSLDNVLPSAPEDLNQDYEPTEAEIQEALAELIEAEKSGDNVSFLRSKAGKWLVRSVVALLAAGGATAVTLGVINSNNIEANEPGDKTPVATGELTTPEISVPSVESLEISADKTPEQTGEAIAKLFSDWGMAGANRETYEARLIGDNGFLTKEEYALKVAQANAEAYGLAIYGPDYKNPEFAAGMARGIEYNAAIIAAHIATYGDGEVPYTQTADLYSQSYVDNGDGTVTYTIEYSRQDNGGDSRIGETGQNGKISTAIYKIGTADGVVRLVEPELFK